MLQKANWVKALGLIKGSARLKYEMGLMKQQYPQFDFHIDSDGCTMYVDGFIITQCENGYHLRVYFPENYPYSPPVSIILDPDIVREHQTQRLPHNYGIEKDGLRLCVIKPDDIVGQPWTPKLSSITMVKFAATWLQAYELWKIKKEWYLREAHG